MATDNSSLLTLHAPFPPYYVVQPDFVFHGKMQTPECLPFWRRQLSTKEKSHTHKSHLERKIKILSRD